MPLKVIGAGFGRTGTLSLKSALEKLGFGPCYHMTRIFEHIDHAPMWQQFAAGERSDWDSLLGDFIGSQDTPSPMHEAFRQMQIEELSRLLDELCERERRILELRYGLKILDKNNGAALQHDQPQTLEEIGKIFGISRERVRQIEKEALDKLRSLRMRMRLEKYERLKGESEIYQSN